MSNMESAQIQMPPPSVPGSAATWIGTTTRSGRRSVPVLDFWRTGGKETESSSTILGESSSEKRRVTTAKCKRRHHSKKSTAKTCKTAPYSSEQTDLVAKGGRAGLAMDGVSPRVKVAISARGRKAAAWVGVGIRRDAAPVLDWWRNQSSTNATDGGAVEQPHQGPLTPAKSTDISGYGACFYSPQLKMAGHNSDSGEAQWSEGQLHSLRVAQADTDPSTSNFWGAVAGRVKGRDPQQCQQKWFEYIATPRGRARNGSKQCPNSLKTQAPLSAPPTDQQGDVADIDDLFQATPMRERRRAGASSRSDEVGPKTPKTPAGPGAPQDDISMAKFTPEDGCGNYERVVSRTYVQAMSKKIRKGSSQSVRKSVAAGTEFSRAPCGVVDRCRTVHAADVSRGHRLKASVSSTGTVRIASTSSSDEDSFGLPDDEGSDDE